MNAKLWCLSSGSRVCARVVEGLTLDDGVLLPANTMQNVKRSGMIFAYKFELEIFCFLAAILVTYKSPKELVSKRDDLASNIYIRAPHASCCHALRKTWLQRLDGRSLSDEAADLVKGLLSHGSLIQVPATVMPFTSTNPRRPALMFKLGITHTQHTQISSFRHTIRSVWITSLPRTHLHLPLAKPKALLLKWTTQWTWLMFVW